MTRQARWQLARTKKGLCRVCGRKRGLNGTKNHCGPCRKADNEKRRSKY